MRCAQISKSWPNASGCSCCRIRARDNCGLVGSNHIRNGARLAAMRADGRFDYGYRNDVICTWQQSCATRRTDTVIRCRGDIVPFVGLALNRGNCKYCNLGRRNDCAICNPVQRPFRHVARNSRRCLTTVPSHPFCPNGPRRRAVEQVF